MRQDPALTQSERHGDFHFDKLTIVFLPEFAFGGEFLERGDLVCRDIPARTAAAYMFLFFGDGSKRHCDGAKPLPRVLDRLFARRDGGDEVSELVGFVFCFLPPTPPFQRPTLLFEFVYGVHRRAALHFGGGHFPDLVDQRGNERLRPSDIGGIREFFPAIIQA